MPSIHIREDVFSVLVDQEGGYEAAKDRVKAAAREVAGMDGEVDG